MTYALLLVGLLFIGIVLFIRVRNHINYCRRASENAAGERIPGCPDFDPADSGPAATSETTDKNASEQRTSDQN
ncbi:MAG: hypothetical protein LC641_06570 [Spirochaeta sp.]|nr:hypothetical protein [Spirochaeta sp.]